MATNALEHEESAKWPSAGLDLIDLLAVKLPSYLILFTWDLFSSFLNILNIKTWKTLTVISPFLSLLIRLVDHFIHSDVNLIQDYSRRNAPVIIASVFHIWSETCDVKKNKAWNSTMLLLQSRWSRIRAILEVKQSRS